MKLVFLGTPQFAVPTLRAIVDAGHEVVAVYTQPDRPKGRGQELALSPVKAAALELGLVVRQPERIRRPEIVEELREADSDAMVIVGYGQIIPQAIIDLPRLGIINVHGSLLPKYRGAAPIQWAIANGETVTGVTTMKIDAGLDTGDMLLKAEIAIGPDETSLDVAPRMADLGARLLVDTLQRLESGTIVPEKQKDSEATLAPILEKETGLVDWNAPAASIHNHARGFLPWPGAWTWFRGQRFNIWKTRLCDQAGMTPGELKFEGRRLLAGCGAGTAIELLQVQAEGRKRVSAADFANGQRLAAGEHLGESKS